MTHKNIYNPLDVQVQTGFKGEYFTIPSKGTETFPSELVERFIGIYPFLEIREKAVEKVKEVKVEEKPEKKETKTKKTKK